MTDFDSTSANTSVTKPVNTSVWIDGTGCYPQPWGGWYPQYPYPIYPTYYPVVPQVVTQQIVIPRGLTDEEIDRIADKVAEKLRAEKKRARG
jgi:hypothetical protein